MYVGDEIKSSGKFAILYPYKMKMQCMSVSHYNQDLNDNRNWKRTPKDPSNKDNDWLIFVRSNTIG